MEKDAKKTIRLLRLAVPVPVRKSFFYYGGEIEVLAGDVVEIKFSGRKEYGLCLEIIDIDGDLDEYEGVPLSKIIEIGGLMLRGVISPTMLNFIGHFCEYNALTLGTSLELFVPSLILQSGSLMLFDEFEVCVNWQEIVAHCGVRKKKFTTICYYLVEQKVATFFEIKKNFSLQHATILDMISSGLVRKTNTTPQIATREPSALEFSLNSLNEEQSSAVNKLNALDLNNYSSTLLYGITGSGKTEVYCHFIANAVKKMDEDGQILITMPEITMTSIITERLYGKFGKNIVLWHSSLTPNQKKEALYGILSGSVRIIIGTRSAILLPYRNLKMIIIDEEHDGSYKQNDSPVYNARDMAVLRASKGNFPLLLCSATPSIETWHNAKNGKYGLVEILNRFYLQAESSSIEIVDTKINKPEKNRQLSPISTAAIIKTLTKKQQVMVMINRRGYSRMAICNKCNYISECENCDNPLSYHRDKKKLQCHYCQFIKDFSETCPKCHGSNCIKPSGGAGVEKIAEEIQNYITTSAKIATLSSDMKNNEAVGAIFEDIINNKIDIIIGTQIIAKGHNFPNLGLVVALDVDGGSAADDPRVFEKTYQLLTQVAGRAGRFGQESMVIIQTRNPNNPVLQAMLAKESVSFFDAELARRKAQNLPPFSRHIAIIVSSENQTEAEHYSSLLHSKLNQNKNKYDGNIKILGPIPSLMPYLKRQYRYRLIMINTIQSAMRNLLLDTLEATKPKATTHVKIDVDPYSFL